MFVNPSLVGELRALFEAGATPSALIRRIAERHAAEPELDGLVRAYFREAFRVPMLLVGPEQVKRIAAGGALPELNMSVLHRMIRTRPEWDSDAVGTTWLDGLTASDAIPTDPKSLPELVGSWDRLDEDAKRFIQRLLENSAEMHERMMGIAALAERLQQNRAIADPRRAQSA